MKRLEYEWIKGKEYSDRIAAFLYEIDEIVVPALSKRLDIPEYARKLSERAETLFVTDDIASCSVYCDTEIAFISSIAVKKEFLMQHIGTALMDEVKRYVQTKNCRCIQLEVHLENMSAQALYKKAGFVCIRTEGGWKRMEFHCFS